MNKSNLLKEMVLREVEKKDCALIYNWAIDEHVRINSFSSEKIFYDDHIKWFNKKINNINNYFFILVHKGIDVGVIRLDVENQKGIISYSISKDFREKGYGSIIIEKLDEKIKECELDIHELYGEVKYTNKASQKIFKKFGYKEYPLQDKLVYKKEL
ncbi:GNAT family N-acetyltransferase [Clostridium sp. CF012]|uniref:GNAT family N-acetyltransferase n=1 Tax=Clostridium sp. CF012 TaxID=2843319 RepID=UPI001C0C00E4|nr:GNAT family protein [Clostridium sp. CF012]MBU3142327.1 GNAT family N-acetyltransferase [Clostridium sp. CF012]